MADLLEQMRIKRTAALLIALVFGLLVIVTSMITGGGLQFHAVDGAASTLETEETVTFVEPE